MELNLFNERPKIKLYNKSFSHAISVGNGDLNIKSKYFDWDRTGTGYDACVVTEELFSAIDIIPEPKKVGWIIEPESINPQAYDWIVNYDNYSTFQFVITHNAELLKISPKFVYAPLAGCWLYEQERKVYEKTKAISIIVSEKNWTEGHRLRHEVVSKYGDKIDVYGRGYKPIGSVLEALKDYRFTIVIENERSDGWYTEKLINSFKSGCVPIYWGNPSIGSTFNTDGMFRVHTLSEIGRNIDMLVDNSASIYELSRLGVEDNFKRADAYVNTEDWLWENILKHNVC